MNFFQSQQAARRRSSGLLWLFMLAVACLIGLTQLLVMATLHLGAHQGATLHAGFWSTFSWLTLAEIAIGVTAVVLIASVYKMRQLAAGGSAVAEMLGGQLIDRSSRDPDERKLLNIVEEMAIASGIAVPPVYVVEENSINAFAAGHDNRDVAIAVTRGALVLLSRDELQGVIAHEFSHIFNGDMKINLQLLGWLHGILFIGLVGRFLLDSLGRSSSRRHDRRGAGLLLFLGIGLAVIGYSGTFFGKLIKAAVSRQREFLADACAVQYTRQPDGIAGALKKIGGCPSGAIIRHPNAPQLSHLFFGDGLGSQSSLFATHPPLPERIAAIDPHWDGEFIAVDARAASATSPAIDPAHVHIINGQIHYVAPETSAGPAPALLNAAAVTQALETIGTPSAAHLEQARQSLATLPTNLHSLARESRGASAIVHCLVAGTQPEQRSAHLALLQRDAAGSVSSLCENILDEVSALPVTLRLPLIDLCLPSLRELGTRQRQALLQVVIAQVRLDQQVSLFEWALYRMLQDHLAPGRPSHTSLALPALAADASRVLAALALATHPETAAAEAAFRAGCQLLGLDSPAWQPDALADMAGLDRAVQKLARLADLAKPRLLKACCTVLANEGLYTAPSIELLRAIADTLDAPMPPVVAT